MNEEIKVNYYSVIPATVRYCRELKPNEKLLYGELTSLANKNGYCYAQNRYLANLYNVSIETVSRWCSHLQKLGFIKMEVKRNERQEVLARYIYILDTPSHQKNQYPSYLNNQEGIDEKVKDNNIKYNIDDLFNFIINNKSKIPKDFYLALEKLDFIYPKNLLKKMQKENIQKIKEIIYTLYLIYESKFKNLFVKFERETLANLYVSCKSHYTNDFSNYYKQAIINKYYK